MSELCFKMKRASEESTNPRDAGAGKGNVPQRRVTISVNTATHFSGNALLRYALHESFLGRIIKTVFQ